MHNLKSLSEEEFSIEDSYVLHMDELAGRHQFSAQTSRKDNCDSADFPWCFYSMEHSGRFPLYDLADYLADVVSRFTYHLPQLVIAAAIIFTGIYISHPQVTG